MKNEHILNLQQVVPIEIRLEVYKEAIKELASTKSNKHLMAGSKGLCLLLPCILWDLDTYCSKGPDNEKWIWTDTYKAFPELTQELLYELKEYDPIYETQDKYNDLMNQYRLNIVKQWIEDLTNQLILES